MDKTFIICSGPSDNDARTNQVYLNPADHRLAVDSADCMMILAYPFAVRPHPKVQSGYIAMNTIQRRLLGLSTTAGNTVTLQPMSRPPPAEISEITVRIEHIIPSKRGGTVDCKELSELFKAQFMGQCFRPTQQLAVVLDSLRLLATVETLKLDPPESVSDVGRLGVLSVILVTALDRSEIALINITDRQMDAQQRQLIHNFDLENLGIGGLKTEFGEVFRRAFASRIFPPSYIKKLGIKHVKGVLLYGPPGTGKTLIARKIGEILNCRAPRIVNGPEVFNKYVGGTEENVRKLFADAEAEQAAKGDQSQLHLIIFDEFDAICKQRGALRDSTGVGDNVVNQLLSKIDGVDTLNNVLLIGMTNRKDLIDEAILRPGRFEVHVEIGLPDEGGREEIFHIHTRGMRENHIMAKNVDLHELATLTKNYSGAEIEGVVRAAMSNAFNRHIDLEHPSDLVDAQNVEVTRQDFLNGVREVEPAFGQAKEECENLRRGGIISYGAQWGVVQNRCRRYVEQVKEKRIQHLALLIDGPGGCGKSAVAAYLSELTEFPYVKVVSANSMVGYGELQKVNIISKAFEDAYKSAASCLILDDLERLIEFSQLGGRYSNTLLQALLVLIKRPPPEGKKLLVIATTAQYSIMDALEVASCFSLKLQIPLVPPEDIPQVAREMNIKFVSEDDQHNILQMFPRAMPIKQLQLVMEMATERVSNDAYCVTLHSMMQAMEAASISL